MILFLLPKIFPQFMSSHIGSQACSGTSEWQSWGQHITVPSGAVKKAAMTQGQSREDTARPRCQAELTRLQEDSHLQILPQKGLKLLGFVT